MTTKFTTERPTAREAMISVRLSAEQHEALEALAEKHGVPKAEIFRIALEYWANSPAGKRKGG